MQVPVLSVWQPDWHAVPDQRSVRPAPAAPLPGHGGTPGGRPLMGKNAYKTQKEKYIHFCWLRVQSVGQFDLSVTRFQKVVCSSPKTSVPFGQKEKQCDL